MLTEEQISKLPKWAQSELRVLAMRLNEAATELKRMKENTPSNTIAGYGYDMTEDGDQFLRENQNIAFKLSNGQISAHINKGMVEIQAQTNFDYDLVVQPHVSNVVYLKLLKTD